MAEAVERLKKMKEEREEKLRKENLEKQKQEEKLRKEQLEREAEREAERKRKKEEKEKKRKLELKEEEGEGEGEEELKKSKQVKKEIKLDVISNFQIHPDSIKLKEFAKEYIIKDNDNSVNYDIIYKNSISQEAFINHIKSKVQYKNLKEIRCDNQNIFLKREDSEKNIIFVCKICKKEPEQYFAYRKHRDSSDYSLYLEAEKQDTFIEVIWNYSQHPNAKTWLFDGIGANSYAKAPDKEDIHSKKGIIYGIVKSEKARHGALLHATFDYLNEIFSPNLDIILKLIKENPSIIIDEDGLKQFIQKSIK